MLAVFSQEQYSFSIFLVKKSPKIDVAILQMLKKALN
jgi:hypothetical protein